LHPQIVFKLYQTFPGRAQQLFGVINKHRFVTEILAKGWHKKSFTFQDDKGIHLQIETDIYIEYFANGESRFEKNFSHDLEKKWFVQAGLTGDI
jgi:hypothetical protein